MIGTGNSLRMFSFEEKEKHQRLAMRMIQWPPFYIYVFAHCTIVFWHSFAFKSRSKDICIWAKTEIFCPSTKYTFCLEDQRHGKRVCQRTLKIPPLAVARFKEICREQKDQGPNFPKISAKNSSTVGSQSYKVAEETVSLFFWQNLIKTPPHTKTRACEHIFSPSGSSWSYCRIGIFAITGRFANYCSLSQNNGDNCRLLQST